VTVAPRPPLAARLTPTQWLVLDCVGAAWYGVVAWWILGHELTAWSSIGLLALVTVPLVLGRRFPFAALVVATAALSLSWTAPAVGFAALAPVSYTLYRVATRSRPVVAATALVGALAGSVATALPDLEHRGAILPFAMVFITTWTVGYAVRQQRAYVARLADHHRQLAEAEITRTRRRAVEERLEMARELHDVVAHSMTVVTVQAGYAHLVIEQEPAKARHALGVIETTGRKSLAELRALMEVLRRDDPPDEDKPPPLHPVPGLADLEGLLADTARAGVVVDLVVRGTPRALPTGVDLSAYRIVQEALTNVVKHAAVAEARAVVDFGADTLTIHVTDEGAGCGLGDHEAATRGHGLIGMQERVSTYGGRLSAEAMPGRGFRVSASLPLDPAWT
jgi:signal transduction histidine kinase